MQSPNIRVFVSYSRRESKFVDRLESDLKAYDYQPWVDRSKLIGGSEWLDELQLAIETSPALVLVLTPDAVASRYVRMEYRHALRLERLVIPLELSKCEKVPMDLYDIQWIDFRNSYEKGFESLIQALSSIKGSLQAPGIQGLAEENYNPVVEEHQSDTSIRLYRSVFISCSIQDTEVVRAIASATKALTGEYPLNPTPTPSEDFRVLIMKAINQADVFQLFWSESAAHSRLVEFEWRYALSLNRNNFIRPVFWSTPLYPPPPELNHLNFSRLMVNLPRSEDE